MAEMFDEITPTYDTLNSVLSAGNDRRWRARTVDRLDPRDGERVLDLGCGTAELLFDVHDRAPDAELVGVDVAPRMLARAHGKAVDLGVDLQLLRGDATRLPLADGSVDAATSAFTLRNVPGVAPFFEEVHRVLVPGGRVVTLEIHLPDEGLLAAIYRPYFLHVLPWIGDLVSGRTGAYKYLARSVESFHDPDGVAGIARKAGFETVEVQELTFGTAAIVWAKKAP